MRIIAGEFRSRRLITPKDDLTTRPIPDRVKESLFGLLRGHCEGATVFDGFAGTGALGLEAISRGAERCVFVERDKGAAEMLRQNIEALGVTDRCELVVGDALGPGALATAPRPLALAFMDPPYPLVREAVGWMRVRAQVEQLIKILRADGFVMLRTPWPFSLEKRDEGPLPRPVRRKKKGGEERWSLEKEEWERWAKRPVAEEPGPVQEEQPEVSIERTPADLSVPGATGPETHVYAATAVHLYQQEKRRSDEETT